LLVGARAGHRLLDLLLDLPGLLVNPLLLTELFLAGCLLLLLPARCAGILILS